MGELPAWVGGVESSVWSRALTAVTAPKPREGLWGPSGHRNFPFLCPNWGWTEEHKIQKPSLFDKPVEITHEWVVPLQEQTHSEVTLHLQAFQDNKKVKIYLILYKYKEKKKPLSVFSL